MDHPVRIYLVGAHSTGKTTLARWVRDRYGLPMISEVARGVLAEMEAQLDALRSDLDLVDRYQREVFERQIECEGRIEGGFVSDRAFCNLAYAAHHSTVLGAIARDPRLADYMDSVRGGIVFYVRPHRELVRADGVRAGLEWEEVVRIDGMVKLMLEMFSVPYIPLESLSMQERVRAIDRVLSLAGVQPGPPGDGRDRIERDVTLRPAARSNGKGSRERQRSRERERERERERRAPRQRRGGLTVLRGAPPRHRCH
ncbi:MAG: ATP-binding protein [Planctomycetota bacterium]